MRSQPSFWDLSKVNMWLSPLRLFGCTWAWTPSFLPFYFTGSFLLIRLTHSYGPFTEAPLNLRGQTGGWKEVVGVGMRDRAQERTWMGLSNTSINSTKWQRNDQGVFCSDPKHTTRSFDPFWGLPSSPPHIRSDATWGQKSHGCSQFCHLSLLLLPADDMSWKAARA